MLRCDVFEVQLELSSDKRSLTYDIWTDLPDGTQVTIECQRSYLDVENQPSLWIGFNERISMKANYRNPYCGSGGTIDILQSDAKAFEYFKMINGKHLRANIEIGNDLTVVCTVGARQRIATFGRNNSSLTGSKVSNVGGINVVSISKTIELPLSKDVSHNVAALCKLG